MSIASSIFDYTNMSADGLVSNILYTFTPTLASPPSIFSDYVNPAFPIFTPDILANNSAVFTGLTHRDKNGQVASVSSLCVDMPWPLLTFDSSGLFYIKIRFLLLCFWTAVTRW
jgi:hypothetical protein